MPLAKGNKIRPVRASRRPSAIPTAPLDSDSEDWVSSALDIARRAAMAEDLACHVPSIKGIADIFTQMLGWLQVMQQNKADFRVITDEIASLIDAVLRYARENDPAHQRYRNVCDNLLSTLSSLQSELCRVFGGSGIPTKEFPRANAYKTVLSYQFRIGCLRGNLQALTSLPPLSMGILSNPNDVTIVGGTFTELQGHQYIFHIHGTSGIQMSSDRTGDADTQTSTGGTDDLDFSDYRVFKYGDLRAISLPTRRDQSAMSEEYTVRIHNDTMTARTYRGNSAAQRFKNDVRAILEHNFRHPYIVQLFGVCLSRRVPTLIFHGDLKQLNFQLSLKPRELWNRRFRTHGECQAAFRYLIQEHQFHLACGVLTHEDQISYNVRRENCSVSVNVYFGNRNFLLYTDKSQRLQVSFDPPGTLGDSLGVFTCLPCQMFSIHEMKAFRDALERGGSIPDAYRTNKQKCLHVIYDFAITVSNVLPYVPSTLDLIIFISPLKHAQAARLVFDREYPFTSKGWSTEQNASDVQMSHVTIDNLSWKRFVIPHVPSERQGGHPKIRCHARFDAPRLYLKTWLAQGQRIISKVKSLCHNNCERDILLVTGVECSIFFQSCFAPSSSFPVPESVFLFVQDLQDVDDVFEVSWFWAKDPDGMERLSQIDMLILGLGKLYQSKIYLETWKVAPPVSWPDLRMFHEILGFDADSEDIARFLNLPIASVEWDGDDNSPLTPWEAFTLHEDELKCYKV